MLVMSVDGYGLEVRQIAGSGSLSPLVFLHEGLGCVSSWTQAGQDWPQKVCEATGRAGLLYSRRGYGQSDPAPPGRHVLAPDYMHHQAWDVLPALLAQLRSVHPGFDKPVLVGHSDGATIALLYASRFPVSACIAMAPHVIFEEIAVTAIKAAKSAFESGGLRQRLARHHADVDGAFWQWNDVWLSQGFRRFDIRPECRQITAPLMLVQGLNDEYGTMEQLDEICRAVPHAVQHRLPGCGHTPQRDQPEKTLEEICDFLENVV